ncbi:sensor histidine kinase [Streptomyces sp. NPDC054933]
MIATFRTRSRTRQALICLVGTGLGALVVLEGLNAPYLPLAVATAASGVLCLAALFAPERRFWQSVTVATTFSCVLSVVETQLPHRPENTPGMVELSALLLLITRAVRRNPPLKAAALAAAPAVAAVLVPLRIAEWDDHLKNLIAFLAVCTVPFMVVLGLGLRLRDALRAREREGIRQAQRLEHARELHDFVAHHVAAIVAQTKAARFTAAAGQAQSPEDLDRMLAQIERAGSQALGAMRAMVSALRDTTAPATTRPAGDLGGLRELTEEFSLVGPPATLTLDPRLADRPLPPEIATTVYHVVQESLTNVRKHATGAGRVEVTVAPRPEAPDHLEVSVIDDGSRSGRAPRARTDGGGFGLVGLAERVQEIGGRITAERPDTGGWRVLAVLPLDPVSFPA